MFDVLKKLFKSKPTALEVAQQRLALFVYACELFLQKSTFNNPEKANLAKHMIFLGAADSSSQLHSLPDIDFAKLTDTMFEKLGLNTVYRELLLEYFCTSMEKNISAKEAVIEGGNMFNKWIQGNAAIPMTIILTLENYHNNPNFPTSPGKLYVDMRK